MKLSHTVEPIDTSVFSAVSVIPGRYTWIAELSLFWANSGLFTTVLEDQLANNLFAVEYVDDNAKVLEYNSEAFIANFSIVAGIENALNASVKIVGSGSLVISVTNY